LRHFIHPPAPAPRFVSAGGFSKGKSLCLEGPRPFSLDQKYVSVHLQNPPSFTARRAGLVATVVDEVGRDQGLEGFLCVDALAISPPHPC